MHEHQFNHFYYFLTFERPDADEKLDKLGFGLFY